MTLVWLIVGITIAISIFIIGDTQGWWIKTKLRYENANNKKVLYKT